jgi:hypothetical protein
MDRPSVNNNTVLLVLIDAGGYFRVIFCFHAHGHDINPVAVTDLIRMFIMFRLLLENSTTRSLGLELPLELTKAEDCPC